MASIAPETRMGSVHLTVSDLARSLDYYQRVVGLQVQARGNGHASLGTGGEDLLVLYEQPGAEPAPRNTGLFHFALLLPSRHDLARWLAHAANDQLPLEGLSDHLVSEAIYLRDPDWHGIEIYRDRPRAEWERDGEYVKMATLPLDVQDLLGALDGGERTFEHLPRGTTMGHVHLQVADIPSSERFYAEQLGLDLQARYGSAATFLSAGGYHHHLGANVWNSRGASPPPDGAAALRYFTVVLPDEGELDRVAGQFPDAEPDPGGNGVLLTDPSQNKLLLTVPRK
ncbi:MAG TPA: VOC family protein [Thermoleophilaceae bacterium]|jgi:catechol 2,3-dioxygenase|nr:VOC family protein [Thermoleophilaceae bacterium]